MARKSKHTPSEVMSEFAREAGVLGTRVTRAARKVAAAIGLTDAAPMRKGGSTSRRKRTTATTGTAVGAKRTAAKRTATKKATSAKKTVGAKRTAAKKSVGTKRTGTKKSVGAKRTAAKKVAR